MPGRGDWRVPVTVPVPGLDRYYYSDPQVWGDCHRPPAPCASDFRPTLRRPETLQVAPCRRPERSPCRYNNSWRYDTRTQPDSRFLSGGFPPRGEPRPAGHSDLSGARGGHEFRYRRPPARAQRVCNSSSDQSDSSFQGVGVRYPSAQRFRRVSRPINESETETSVGSVTFRSETSNNESAPEVLPSKAAASEGASESTGSKDVPTSSAPKQPLRVRRGYIQIGLGDLSKPPFLRSCSDPNA